MEHGPIYIGGLDRCGKTMMRAFLVSHPRIAIPAVGSNLWTYFYGQYGDLSSRANFERCLDALLRYKHILYLNPDPQRIRQEFWQGSPSYARLFALFLQHYAERKGRPRWGAQTGVIERYADHLFAAFPGVQLIHLIRDPRDRYAASSARAPNAKGGIGGATARWLYSVKLAKRNQKKYPGRYLIVQYEALVSQPEQTMRDVCAFLNEEYTPAMLTMEGAPEYRAKLLRGAPAMPGQSPLSTEFIGSFRGSVSPQEIAFMQAFAGREMLRYGYALEPTLDSLRDRLRFSLVEWPLNLARMVAWRSLEAVQQNYPARFGRKPAQKTLIEHQDKGIGKLQTL